MDSITTMIQNNEIDRNGVIAKVENDPSKLCIQNDLVYVRPGVFSMSKRKLDSLKHIAAIQKYYQCNPVRFVSDFFGIELLDSQSFILTRTWVCPHVLLVCSRGFGKSTLIDIMIMAKGMLFNNYWSYICSGSGSQAQQTFTTLERIANNNIDTMVGSTGEIFKAEVEVKNAVGDGFSHSSDGFRYNLFNGSFTQTLNSNVDKHLVEAYRNMCYVLFELLKSLKGNKLQHKDEICLSANAVKTERIITFIYERNL